MSKTIRNLSGIYFRYKPKDSEKFKNIVFEDLPEEEQKRQMKDRSKEWLENMVLQLANTINEIADITDIIKE